MSQSRTKIAYNDLIVQDIAWLIHNTTDSLERQHIIKILDKEKKSPDNWNWALNNSTNENKK